MKLKSTLKITAVLLASCFYGNAQITTVIANTGAPSTLNGTGTITNAGNAYDSAGDYLSTKATITSVVLTGNDRYIDLVFPTNLPVGNYAYVKLRAETPVLDGLLGGALGNLITDLLGTLVDGKQTVLVEAFSTASGSTGQLTAASAPVTEVVTSSGEHFMRIRSTAAIKRIRIINHAIAGLTDADKWLEVYGAYYTTGNSNCVSARYTSFSGSGLVSVVDTGVLNPKNAIDASNSTYSSLNLGVVSVASWVEQTVYFEGTSSTTDKYNIKLSLAPSLLQATVLSNIVIQGYSGAGTTASYSKNLNELLGLAGAEALGLLQNNKPVTLTLSPAAAIDRIVVRYTGVLNVNLGLQELRLYSIKKGNFDLAVTGGGSYQVGANLPLTAVTSNATCGSSFTYQWSGASTATTSGITANTSTPGTYTYYVIATDANGIEKSGYTTVVVEQPPVGGNLNNIIAGCTTTAAGTLTLTGYTGTILRWEKSSNAAFTTPVTVNNTTATLAVTGIAAPTYYRAVVSLNSYAPVYSATATVSPKFTEWNGTSWSNGTPDITTIIYFNANYHVATNLTGCTAFVKNDAVVTIPEGYLLHLNGALKVESGSFTLENNANLTQDLATAVNEGNITVTRKSSLLHRLDYTFWSTPVAGQQLKAFSPNTLEDRFYYYAYGYDSSINQTLEQYWRINPNENNFETCRGYLIRMPNWSETPGYNNGTVPVLFEGQFTGVPNNGTKNYVLNIEGGRYTAVGNPYPSPINVHDFFNTNSAVLMPGSALYFWRKKNNSNASSYATLTYDVYTYNHATGGNAGEGAYGGSEWDDHFNTANANNWTINIGQAFIVRSNTGFTTDNKPKITFNNAMRRGGIHTGQFFKTAQDDDDDLKSKMWIDFTGAGDSFSQMALVYSNSATLGIDYGRDAELMTSVGSSVSIWSKIDDMKLVVQARPAFQNTDVVPVAYRADAAGQHTITLHRADGLFSQGQNVYLKDNLTGNTINITNAPYTFTTDAGTYNSRFEIVYIPQGSLGIDGAAPQDNNVVVYKQHNSINITSGNAQIEAITIYDVHGRELYKHDNLNTLQTEVNNLTIQQQVVIVEVTTTKGKVSRKIVY